MPNLLDDLQQRSPEAWLMGLDAARLIVRSQQRCQELQPRLAASGNPPVILLATAEPVEFLAGFIAACTAACPVFLGNPHWAEAEWRQAMALIAPDLLWQGPDDRRFENHVSEPVFSKRQNWAGQHTSPIFVPTGGSTGQVRFAVHTWETLTASVEGFRQYFAVDRVHSCCLLPLYHVSGLMQFLRSFLSGGRLAVLPPSVVETGLTEFDPAGFFLSLVPTQLQRALAHPEAIDWLRQFRTVLLGGAPAWPDLLEQGQAAHIPLAPTYGMTETASQVATLKPEEFLNGQTGSGRVLPHARIEILNEQGQALGAGQVGTIAIQARSLCLGYYPANPAPGQTHSHLTDDLGYFDANQVLHLIGRSSHKIISGGENIFPPEVEAAIRASGLVADVCVVGLPDRHWGEIVVAVYVPSTVQHSGTVTQLQAALTDRLSRFKHPKRWIAVAELPRSPQGKLNYRQIQQIAAEAMALQPLQAQPQAAL